MQNTFGRPLGLRNTFYTSPEELEAAKSIAAETQVSGLSSMGRGLLQGMHTTPAMLADAGSVYTEPVFPELSNSLRNWSAEQYQQARGIPLPVSSVEDVDGVGSAGSYIAGKIGQTLPQMGVTLPAGVAGGLAGGPVGALAAMYGANVAMTSGEQARNFFEDPAIMGSTTPGQRAGEALKYGTAAGALDTVGDAVFGSRLLGMGQAVKAGVMPAIKHMSKTVPEAAVTEGLPELGQQALSQAQLSHLNPDRDTSGDAAELKEAFFGGWAGGSGLTGAGRAVQVAKPNIEAASKALGDTASAVRNRLADVLRPSTLPPELNNASDEEILAWDSQQRELKHRAAEELAADAMNDPSSSQTLKQRAAQFFEDVKNGVSDAWQEFSKGVEVERTVQRAQDGLDRFSEALRSRFKGAPGAAAASASSREMTADDQAVFGILRESLPPSFSERGDPASLYMALREALTSNDPDLPWAALVDTFGTEQRAASALTRMHEGLARMGEVEADPEFGTKVSGLLKLSNERDNTEHARFLATLLPRHGNVDKQTALKTISDIKRGIRSYSDMKPEMRRQFDARMTELFGNRANDYLNSLVTNDTQLDLDGETEIDEDIDAIDGNQDPALQSVRETDGPSIRYIGSAQKNVDENAVGSKRHGGFFNLAHKNEEVRGNIQRRMLAAKAEAKQRGMSVRELTPLEYARSAGINPNVIAEELGVKVDELGKHPARILRVEDAPPGVLRDDPLDMSTEELNKLGATQTQKVLRPRASVDAETANKVREALSKPAKGGERFKALGAAGYPHAVSVESVGGKHFIQMDLNYGGAGRFTVVKTDGTRQVMDAQKLIARQRKAMRGQDPSAGPQGVADLQRQFASAVSSILNNPDVQGIEVKDVFGKVVTKQDEVMGAFGPFFQLMSTRDGNKVTLGQSNRKQVRGDKGRDAEREIYDAQDRLGELQERLAEIESMSPLHLSDEESSQIDVEYHDIQDEIESLEANLAERLAEDGYLSTLTGEESENAATTFEIAEAQEVQEAKSPKAREFDETGQALGQPTNVGKNAGARAMLQADIKTLESEIKSLSEAKGVPAKNRLAKLQVQLDAKRAELEALGGPVKPVTKPEPVRQQPKNDPRDIEAEIEDANRSSRERDYSEYEATAPVEQRAKTLTALVDQAAPPKFAREKEVAKADGADFVFAPKGFKGSYASRLAEASEKAGVLLDPNDTQDIRGKVVYVSVPGKGRGFTPQNLQAFANAVAKILDRGAVVRIDTKENASRSHNADGEGRLRTALVLTGMQFENKGLYDEVYKNLPAKRSAKTAREKSQQTEGRGQVEETVGEIVTEATEQVQNQGAKKSDLDELNEVMAALKKAVVETYGRVADAVSGAREGRGILARETIDALVDALRTALRAFIAAAKVTGQKVDKLRKLIQKKIAEAQQARSAIETQRRVVNKIMSDARARIAERIKSGDTPTLRKIPEEMLAEMNLPGSLEGLANSVLQATEKDTIVIEELLKAVENLGLGKGFDRFAVYDAASTAWAAVYPSSKTLIVSKRVINLMTEGAPAMQQRFERLAYRTMVHELVHMEDLRGSEPIKGVKHIARPLFHSTNNERFWFGGDLRMEAERVNQNPTLKAYFSYPLDYNMSEDVIPRELVAQAVSAYYTNPAALLKDSPLFYDFAKEVSDGLMGQNRDAVLRALSGVQKSGGNPGGGGAGANAGSSRGAAAAAGARSQTGETGRQTGAAGSAAQQSLAGRGRSLLNKARDLVVTSQNTLIDSDNKTLERLGRMFSNETGSTDENISFLSARVQKTNEYLGRLVESLAGYEKITLSNAVKGLQAGTLAADGSKVREVQDKIRALLDDLLDFMQKAGVGVEKRKNYFPRTWDPSALTDNRLEFIDQLKADHLKVKGRALSDESANAVFNVLVLNRGAEPVAESDYHIGYTPYMQAAIARKLDYLVSDYSKFQRSDAVDILSTYISQAVHRAEYARRFGNDGAVLREVLKDAYGEEVSRVTGSATAWRRAQDAATREEAELAKKEGRQATPDNVTIDKIKAHLTGADDAVRQADAVIARARKAVMAMEGTLGAQAEGKMKELLRRYTPALVVYQNFRLLWLSLFSQFIDPLGVMVRGGTAKEAFNAYVRGLRGVMHGWRGTEAEDSATQLARKLGVIDATNALNTMGNMYSATYLDGRAKKINDALFRWNGVEQFSQGVRVGATEAAVSFIKFHLEKGNRHSERYLAELGLKKGDTFDIDSPKIRDAIFRWVDGATVRPNAALRPPWASDPHYALFFHMKQFTYAFHKIILERMISEAKHGNYDPIYVALAAYVPVMVAADVVRGFVGNGGDEPPWMRRADAGDIVLRGVERAGLLGIPQLGKDVLEWGPLEVGGPTVEHAAETISNMVGGDFNKAWRDALPAVNVIKDALDFK